MMETANLTVPENPPWRPGHFLLTLAVAIAWLGLSAANLWMGELNQDEGWYLYAARLLTEGRLPYRDFAFTQPPMLPLVYSWVYGWIGELGLLGGRLLTWAFGALGLLCAVWLTMRAGPRSARRFAGGACLILIALNSYQSYFTTVVKTYSLASFFLCGGLLLLSFVGPRRGFGAALGAGVLLAAAAATRISLGITLLLGAVYLWGCRRRLCAWAWLDFIVGGLFGLTFTLLPFWVLGREGFEFGVLEYHSLRSVGSWGTQWAYKGGSLSRLVQAYYPAAAGGMALLILAFRHLARRGRLPDGITTPPPEPAPEDIGPCYNAFLWVAVIAMAAVHLAAPFPYDDYQVPVYPVYCAALAATFSRWWLREEARRFNFGTPAGRSARRLAILTFLALICGLHVFASPVTQGWFVAGRDRIWWRLRPESPVAQLQTWGKWLRDLTLAQNGSELITQDIYLAVEARLPVPRGLEMGPFCYYPDWPESRARKLGVVNRDMMRDLLLQATNAPIAAFSGYGLAIRAPEVTEISREDRQMFESILRDQFDHVESVPGFGQAATTLEIWRRKPVPETPAEPAEDVE